MDRDSLMALIYSIGLVVTVAASAEAAVAIVPSPCSYSPPAVALPGLLNVAVGHAGNVIGNGASQALGGNFRLVVGGQQAGVGDDCREQFPDDLGGVGVLLLHAGRFVQIGVEKLFGCQARGLHLRAQSRQPLGSASNPVQCRRAQRGDLPACLFHQIRDQSVENALESLVDAQLGRSGGIIAQHSVVEAAEECHALAHLAKRENARVQAVVQVGGQVGDLVGQIDKLSFQGRELVEEVLGHLRVGGGGVVMGVLNRSEEHTS